MRSNAISRKAREPRQRYTPAAAVAAVRARGLTQAQLGAMLGVTQAAAGQKLSGKIEWSYSDLVRLAAGLQLPIDHLV